ncbi:MAG: DUF4442 domain-containing protein [Verrucomicrobia bacterium]|nr:DUF4442 domain-containing protein [Verrucomicrobiota bacterium]
MHASALMALAEATSGQFLLTEYTELEDGTTVPVVRKFEAKFRKPAIGAVSSTASALPDTRVAFKETFRRRGKATLYVAVDVSDEHGTHALSAMVGWFVKRVDK